MQIYEKLCHEFQLWQNYMELGYIMDEHMDDPAAATSWSCSTEPPDTPIAPTILPSLFRSTTPPGKVINPPLECSMLYNGPPGCDNLPISPESMSKKRAVFAFLIAMSIDLIPTRHCPSGERRRGLPLHRQWRCSLERLFPVLFLWLPATTFLQDLMWCPYVLILRPPEHQKAHRY